MTAALNADAERVMQNLRAPVVLDLDKPGAYEGQLNLAASIATFLLEMPLEEMARRAADIANITLMKPGNSDLPQRETRDLARILRDTQTQLKAWRRRYDR